MRYIRLLPVALATLPALAASQVIAFNDFGPDTNSSTYGYGKNGNSLGGSDFPGSQYVAAQFTAGASGVVSDLLLPIGSISGSVNYTVQLLTDTGGGFSGPVSMGSVMETWNMSATNRFSSWTLPTTLNGDGSASLLASSKYWVLVVPDHGADGAWYVNDQGVSGTYAVNDGGTGWIWANGSQFATFQVNVTPAPEPVTIIGLGCAMLLLRRRKQLTATIPISN